MEIDFDTLFFGLAEMLTDRKDKAQDNQSCAA